jgi:hypothetical protein
MILGPMGTRGFNLGRTFGFSIARWLLPKEAIVGRPLSRPIKGRGWPHTNVQTQEQGDARTSRTRTPNTKTKGRRTGGGRTDEDLETGATRPSQDLVRTPLCNP